MKPGLHHYAARFADLRRMRWTTDSGILYMIRVRPLAGDSDRKQSTSGSFLTMQRTRSKLIRSILATSLMT